MWQKNCRKMLRLKNKLFKKNKKLVSDNLIVKGKDKRNYKVNFDKFSKTFKFRADYKIDNGIKKINFKS